MKKVVLLFAFLLLVVCGCAQTVKWLVEPKYSSITHYSNDIFKCTDQNGKMQLLDWEGKPLNIPANADAVTEYSDGYAIVLQGDKILGFLAEAKPHVFQSVSGDYYATKYSFFSEGYVAVAQGSVNGKQGYLDTKGYPVLECQYIEAMPVRQGWALVTENGKDKVKPRRYKQAGNWSKSGMSSLKSGESLVWATSFNANGLALTKVKSGKYVVIDVNFNEIEKNAKGSKEEVNRYDFSYKPAGSEEVKAPVNDQPVKDGYEVGSIIPPNQFGNAEEFYSGRAIVALGGKYGILELLDGKFEANWSADRIRVYEYANEVEEIQFTLAAPAALDRDRLKVELNKGDGRFVDCDGLRYDFKVANQVTSRKERNCTLQAKATYSENGPELLLWEETKEVGIDHVSISLSSPVTTSEYADENDNQTVKAVVTNTSDVPVKVSATLTVAGKTNSFNVELGRNQSKPLTVTVKVTEDKNVNATVTAKVDGHNCGSKSSTVSLKKI